MADLEPVADNAKDIYEQGRHMYLPVEYSDEDFYKGLPDDIHFYAKATAAQTYKNGYRYTVMYDEKRPDMYVFGKPFEKVSKM